MFRSTIKPEEVFTPRASVVNNEMFVHRDNLENALRKSIRKSKHIVIYGESGCGKTWLYKKVLEENKCHYEAINSASINEGNSLREALTHTLARIKKVEKVAYEEKKHAELNMAISKGSLQHTSKHEIREEEPFLRLIREINKQNNGKPAYLVFDNIEHIIKYSNLSTELFSLMLYLDDEEYAKNNVKIIIVGTPSNIIEYLPSAPENQTIINRLVELPEVSRLTAEQIDNFIQKGFVDLLQYPIIYDKDEESKEYKLLDEHFFADLIEYYTDGIPQYVQELCLEIAINAERNNCTIDDCVVSESINDWILESVISEYARVLKNANSPGTKHGRRNQCIFAMSQIYALEYTTKEIEEELRKQFPNSTQEKNINISTILTELVNSSSPVIRRNQHSKMYRFITPKTKIVTRWMFIRLYDEDLVIRKIDDTAILHR